MVRAVRGATTVENNNAEEIVKETKVLLQKLVEVNSIKEDELISAVFSVTKDLDAEFPAVAARQIGWTNVALMCANEMVVSGSLEKCIRVMVTFNTEKKNSDLKYIYLNKAKVLRPDLVSDIETIKI